MLTVAEALAEIVAHVQHLPAVRVPLDDALGLVLAEEAVSDLDSPPFDKALMDGYAVCTADLVAGQATLRMIEEVLAGQAPQRKVGRGEATRIMTGAPLPTGADAVVQVEHTRVDDDDSVVHIETTGIAAGKNVLHRGESMRRGTRVLPVGRLIRPQEAGCLAELGKVTVGVYRRPRVAVLSTGDELVPVSAVPAPGQIRNSNETMLTAQLRQMGAEPVALGVARDSRAELSERINKGLACDVLVLSGGVSAGKLDLVPSVLVEAGVRQVFHKVKIKPGQPLWFGLRERPDPASGPAAQESEMPGGRAPRPPCHVFGLPGNPVSSMVCCELFVRTAVRRLMGIEPATPTPIRARLARDHVPSGSRPVYHPARWEWSESGPVVELVKWAGSADLCGTVEANGMALFPEGERTYPAGTLVDVFSW